jgi:LAO/AO transport system kinase
MGARRSESESAVRGVSSCLADMGFDVDVAPGGLEIDDVAAMAAENDDHFVLVMPSADRGAEIGNQLRVRLDAFKCPRVQVVQATADLLQGLPKDGLGRSGRDSLAARLAAEFGPRLSRAGSECHPEEYYVQGLLEGSRQVLAQVISLLESHFAEHRELGENIVRQVLPHTGSALRIGVSGVPGVGKSTFIEHFAARLVDRGHRVAILAVDPSSLKSGGSIMGDKTRMPGLCRLPGVFIRPSPSGGALGGVSARTRESMTVCEAAGFDIVLVETVGVGQSETTVASMVDFFLVLMLAGAGDEIQGIKKGILELADAVAVNKADGDNAARAEEARKDYESALSLLLPPCAGWRPVVLTCSALTGRGLDEIWETVCRHRTALQASGELGAKRRRQSVAWMWDLVREGLRERFYSHPRVSRQIREAAERVAAGQSLPTEAALELLALVET